MGGGNGNMAAKNGAGTATNNGTNGTGVKAGDTTSKLRGSSSALESILVGGSRGPGRPPKADIRAYVDAIKRQYPPDVVLEMMISAWITADDTNSWRGKEAILKLILAYTVGNPVKRVESSGDTSLADLLAGVDTSKPLLSIGYDKGQYHKLSSDGDGGNLAGDVSGPGEIMSSDGEGVDE
jgi:hypothetical protein